MVMVGDCGQTRLYKDGIGAAYRTAKAAATTAIFHGIAAGDFAQHFGPVCRALATDNTIGKVIFAFTRQGDTAECMYVIQVGEVEVIREQEDRKVRLTVLGEGDFFGKVPLFERTCGKGGGCVPRCRL